MFNYNALPTSVTSNLWTMFYSGINRANNVLQNLDNAAGISQDKYNMYKAEALVLRSFYYNWLWKLWGNVIYYNQNLQFPYTAPQITANEVYTNVIADLEEAISLNALPMKRASEAEYGRVTQAMAYMLYAEMVMYQNDQSKYSSALKFMEEIIGSGKYDLVSDFKGIWEVEGEWSVESIFEINYFNKSGGKDWGASLAAGGSVYPKLIGINSLSGSPKFEGGWSFEPVRQSTYDMYSATDIRRDGTIYRPADEGASYVPRYQDTGNFLYKYLPRIGGNANCAASADMNYNNNVRIYRFSETLLNAAELIARGATGVGSAKAYLDRVRERAQVPSIDPSIDNILEERHLEFVGEGKRYWDLIRSGKAASVLVADGGYRVNSWTENKKYLPIPQSEMDSTSGTDYPMTQNNY